jgi:hypothetical protein
MDHWKATKNVIRFLQGTKDYKLTYKHTNYLKVIGYSDSDFTGCVDTKNSTLGYIFLFIRECVSWRSTKQTNVAAFIMKAKLTTRYEATTQMI